MIVDEITIVDEEEESICISCGAKGADPCNGCDEPLCESCAAQEPCPICGHQH